MKPSATTTKKADGISGTNGIIGTEELTRFGIGFSLARRARVLTEQKSPCEGIGVESNYMILWRKNEPQAWRSAAQLRHAGKVRRQVGTSCQL